MKKVDLHIHTIKTVSDNDFVFSIETLKRYVSHAEIDIVAITNHNVFDPSQFRLIQQNISAKVFPGIEIDLPSGHILLISDCENLASFEAKCNQVSKIILNATDSITVNELKSIFGDLSDYLLIPHYEKDPSPKGKDFDDLKQYVTAGEVDSAKKYVRTMRDNQKLCPVLFSDSRMHEGMVTFPIRQTFIDCGEVSLSAIKNCFRDRRKVFLSKLDGNKLFQVFEDGQHISTGLNVILGERSSGKTYSLNQLSRAFERVKYIKQFDLVQKNEEEDEKLFNNEVQRKRSRFVDQYLSGLKSILEDVAKIDIINDDRSISEYVSTLLQSAAEADRRDVFSKVKLYDELEFLVGSNDGLKKLIASVIHLIENIEYRPVIESYVQLSSLKSLAVDLIQRLWKKSDQDRNKNYVNSIIKDAKDRLRMRTAATHVESVNMYEIAINKKKVSRFNDIVKAIQKEEIIFDEPVQGFRIVASKGPFLQASEMSATIKRQAAFKDALNAYSNPYTYLQVLLNHDKLEGSDIYRLFVKITYRIINKDRTDVSGGERSEFRLLQEIKDAQNFDILLLDEPESSFDNKFLNSDVNSIIKSISRQMPVVVVTHNNSVGASINPDYVLYAHKSTDNGERKYRLFSGYPTDKQLVAVDGSVLSNFDILLNSLEAGVDAYQIRRGIYEAVKD
ncbi:MAG: phosphotransferase [Proteobacteria bacterium]|nr:phosphotransferase [Pseudomonadota bacterium]